MGALGRPVHRAWRHIWAGLGLWAGLCLGAPAAELVVLIDDATEMPLQLIQQGKLLDGVHKDVGEALATHLGRQARFLVLPRMRVAHALEEGHADVLCAYVPEWLPGPFGWSKPFLPVVNLIATDISAPRPHSLQDLAGQRIGTVRGYVYRELDEPLGKAFVRDDGPSSESNLYKLANGRFAHALVTKALLDYRLKLKDPPLSLHPPLLVREFMTQCAVSRRGHVSLEEVDKAITAMLAEGFMQRVWLRYR